jgi:Acyl carrier protein
MEEKFLEFVADVMDVDASEVSMETVYKDFYAWDSLMMMTLVMELEAEYDVSIPVEELNDVKKLSDLFELINK